MANLAIKGHATRGREVIELLEMLGGRKRTELKGNATTSLYSIFNDGYIDDFNESRYNKDEAKIFTIEEFLEKFPYKVGDKVSSKYLKNYKIEKMEWEIPNNRVIYKLQGMGWYCADELQPYKEETMDEEEENFAECIEKARQECLFGEEETMEEITDTSMAPILQSEDYSGRRFGYKIPKGYEFDCIKENEIIIKPIKPQYPKTYVECAKLLNCFGAAHIDGYKCELLEKFQELLICRDAYWKIAGKEMGLDGPWEPDWTDNYQKKWIINFYQDEINFTTGPNVHFVFAFPTPEMRDAFFENFKDLIEKCKELL